MRVFKISYGPNFGKYEIIHANSYIDAENKFKNSESKFNSYSIFTDTLNITENLSIVEL